MPSLRNFLFLGIVLTLGLSPIFSMVTVRAQDSGFWSSPLPLSRGIVGNNGKLADSMSPVLVADSNGGVHSFWTSGNSIYYSSWDGNSWIKPLDIFYSTSDIFILPQVAIDREDRIHLVWVSGSHKLWYTVVNASDASQVRSWSVPFQVSNEIVGNAFITTSPNGNLHIVYCTYGNENHISYIWSSDGNTWSSPAVIQGVKNEMAPRLAIDESNRFHLVFGDMGAGEAAYYSRSIDNGQTWSYPAIVDQKDDRFEGEYGPAWINVITRGTDEVHLVWDGAPSGQRWHQWSQDGGKNWIKPEQLSSTVRGLTWQNALGIDRTGVMHLFSMGITGTAPFYATWQDGGWSPLEPISDQVWDGEGPTLAISGDQIVVAWWEHSGGLNSPDAIEVWTSFKKINSSLVYPKPQLIETSTLIPTTAGLLPGISRTTTPVITGTETLTNPKTFNTRVNTVATSPIYLILLIGSLPAILIVGMVFYFRWRQNNPL